MALRLGLFGRDLVGKTQLNNRFLYDQFDNFEIPRFIGNYSGGYTYYSRRNIKLYTWIVNSRNAFHDLNMMYLKTCKGVMLVYSVEDEISLSEIPTIIKHVPKDKFMILVGTKCDSDKRKVSKEEGEEMAKMYNLKFFETSAKDNINVHEALVTLIEDTFQELEFNVEPEAEAVTINEGHKNGDKKVSIFQRFKGLFAPSKIPANDTTKGDDPSIVSTTKEVNSSIIEVGTLRNPGPSSQGNTQNDKVEPEPVDLKHVASRGSENEAFSQGTIFDDVNNSNHRNLKPGLHNAHAPESLVCSPGPSVKQADVFEPEDLSFHSSHGVEAVNENDEFQEKSTDNNSDLANEAFSQGTILDDVNNSNHRNLKPDLSNVHAPGPLVCSPGPSVKQPEVPEPENMSVHSSHGVEVVNENDESQHQSKENYSDLAIEPESGFFAARNILESDQVPIENTDTSEYHYEL